MSVGSVAKSVGSSALSNLTGNIDSAHITVHDFRKAAGSVDFSAAVTQKAMTEGIGLFSPKNSMNKEFMVQFNPSEVQLYTSSEPIAKQSTQRKSGENGKTSLGSASPPTAELTVALYFDHMVVADSFMLEKPIMPTSVSGVTNAVMATALSGKMKDRSVQKEVEGFLPALQNPLTRTVTFRWTDFTFTGSLSRVDAKYTMFSNLGRPVRAKMTLTIKQQMNSKTLKSWEESFQSAFKGESTNLVRPEQYAGNLLNLGL